MLPIILATASHTRKEAEVTRISIVRYRFQIAKFCETFSFQVEMPLNRKYIQTKWDKCISVPIKYITV